MSIDIRNLGLASPAVLLGNVTSDFVNGLEAAPFYSSLAVTISLSGTRTQGTETATLSYTRTVTLNRVASRGGHTDDNLIQRIGDIDFGYVTNTLASGQCLMLLAGSLYTTSGFGNRANPKKQAIAFMYPASWFSESGTIVGSWSDGDDEGDIDITLNVGIPQFFLSTGTPENPRATADRWELPFSLSIGGVSTSGTTFGAGEIDVSGWTATKWRDYRGTYGYTLTDTDEGSAWTLQISWTLA